MAAIAIEGVSKVYDGDVLAVDGIDLEVADGELLVLVGPSGCGKSTLLRMVAGLEDVSGGRVQIGESDVTYLQPKDRDIAMVFQSYALYPHMTVRKNIGYPLKVAKVPKAEREQRVAEVAAKLRLEDELDRRPSQLSGGQRQRVAMGRALIRQPQAFLMDEPLSNLDAKLRVEMRAEISRLQRELGITSLYVTHDQVEAMTMGTRVAVLDAGRLQQVDTPQRIYDRPANLFVATFIGSPAMNLLVGRVERRDADWVVDLGSQVLALDDQVVRDLTGLPAREGQQVVVGIRPEALADAALETGAPADRVIEVQVDLVESLGAELMVHVSVAGATPSGAGTTLAAFGSGEAGEAGEGSLVDLGSGGGAAAEAAQRQAGRAIARLNTRSRPQLGDVVKLAVDPTGLHLFDPDTGESLRADAVEAPVGTAAT